MVHGPVPLRPDLPAAQAPMSAVLSRAGGVRSALPEPPGPRARGVLGGLSLAGASRKSPRLILTVVTIGLTQVFSYVGFLIPGWLGEGGRPALMVTPMTHSWQFHIGNQRFSGDYPFTIAAV